MSSRTFAAAAIGALSLAGCASLPPPALLRSGQLPAPGAVVIAGNDDGVALLPTAAAAQCLAAHGFPAGTPAVYLAHIAVAERPARSTVRIGAAANGAPSPAPHHRRGERLVYAFRLDRLADGAPLYAVSLDAPYRPRHSGPAERAAQFCAAAFPATP